MSHLGGGCAGNAAPYVLGALSDEECEQFRRHLESCTVCRDEVAALQAVASALPSAAPQLSAPPELKRRLMASVREDARRREHESAREQARGYEGRVERARAGAQAPPARRRTGALAGWTRRRAALGVGVAGALSAAAVALAVLALASGGGAATRVIRARVTVARASASLRLSGTHAQLQVAGMPQAGRGRVYELWKRSGGGAPRPTDALFTVNRSGDASVGVPGGVRGVEEVMVTSEPLGGSSVPTRAPVIVARVS